MGLAWQQGPLATGSVGLFLTEQPLPTRLLFVEPLRRRMRVRFAGRWIVDSEDVVLLHEPGRYPVAYFPRGDVESGVLTAEDRVTAHQDLGATQWFEVKVAQREASHNDDVSVGELKGVDGQTFCPYKGLASYYDVCTRRRAAWSYVNAWSEVARINNLVSFEPDKIDVYLDDEQLHLEPGQTVVAHGVDRGLDTDEIMRQRKSR
jgi:uncharacterized protein (DUF427 family)